MHDEHARIAQALRSADVRHRLLVRLQLRLARLADPSSRLKLVGG